MKCMRYQEWLADKALGALDARYEAELTAHLAACSRCRAVLDREQVLFAAIHRGVAKSVAALPSLEMAVRIRQRVTMGAAIQRDKRRSQTAPTAWRFGSLPWIPVAAAAALMLALVSLALIHRRTLVERMAETKSAPAKPAPSLGNPLPAVATAGGEGVEPKRGASPVTRGLAARAATRRGRTRVVQTSPAAPEVLVDRQEAVLVLQLYYSANHLPTDGNASVHLSAMPERDADGNLAALEIPPLETTDLEPKPSSDDLEGRAAADAGPSGVQR
jgi:hypothetical protein